MATDVTVGLDPYDKVIRVNFDDVEAGTRAQAEMDEDAAERAAAAFLTGGGALAFTDTITGQRALLPVERNLEVAAYLRAAASDLRAHKAGKIDLRHMTGKVPKV